MVSGNLRSSVVARTKITCSGGSSSVLRRALNALVESMWTSSMMKILYFDLVGRNCALSMIFSRTLSTPVWLAASISSTSIDLDALISSQEGHLSHGSKSLSLRFGQLTAFARTRAMVVLPMPRAPKNR